MGPDQTSEMDPSTMVPLKASNPELIEGIVGGVAIQPLPRTEPPSSRDFISQAVQTDSDPFVEEAPSISTLSPEPASDMVKPLPSIPDRKNIVFFGETGVGKSSVIKMFREGIDSSDSQPIPISSGAVGCTFSSKGYEADVNEGRYMLWDTAGLNEGVKGAVTHEKSVESLEELLLKLDGRIHLLVYCIRGKRFRQVVQDNYDLFYGELCGYQVPIVAVVTGLENEEPNMENWWRENNGELRKYGLTFKGHACITATRGKAMKGGGNRFDEEYEESQIQVRSLIENSCSEAGYSVSGIRKNDSAFQIMGWSLSTAGELRRDSGDGTGDDGYLMPGRFPISNLPNPLRPLRPLKDRFYHWTTRHTPS
ncbi:hypothetical protein H1R20_g13571, partial [Candolleomyces eurysporus]